METFFASSCRLCLKEPPSDSLVFSVFDTYQGSVLVDLIDELFSVKIAKSDRLLSVCLDCVNRINTVRVIQSLFVENNRKLHAWLQNESNSTAIEKNVAYEVYEVTMPGNPPTQPEFEQVLFTQDEPLEETVTSKLQDEPTEGPQADKSDTNTEKVVMLDIEEVCEDEYDAAVDFFGGI
uniref:Uncharacterized protein n=1 Tax=Anopheles atroparvus TaxID=41427 RepID=A0A182J1J2_ANOAO